MKKGSKAALFAALALALPLIAWANHAIKVNPDQWQLIGITGYYTVSTDGDSNTEAPDLRYDNGQGVIDIRDANDNISWDANATGPGNHNVYDGAGINPHFANATGLPALGVNNPSGNLGIGSPYHAIVGLRTLRVGSIEKAVIAFARPEAPSATNGKDYGASLITQYLVSPYSNGEPDVMVVFAANLLNQTFKISFKNSVGAAWSFPTDGSGDAVYSGRFSYDATYDNPLRIGSGLTRILPQTTTTEGTASGYRSFANTIDRNIADNIREGLNELNNTNFQAFEGNFTAYQYNAVGNLWAIATIQDAPKGGIGLQTISALGERGTAGSNNQVQQRVKGDFASWTRGYGYWVRIWGDDGDPATQFGILANDQINGASAYNGIIQNGWNLLAFPDSTLRNTASGFNIGTGANVLQVLSPFGESNVSFPTTGTGAAEKCAIFNFNVQAANGAVGSANALEVTCLANGTNAYLISSKPFYITVNTPVVTAPLIQSLAGRAYTAADLIDINSSGTASALRTKLGEYALLVEPNADYNATFGGAGTAIDNALGLGLPSWYGVGAYAGNGGAFDLTGIQNYLANGASGSARAALLDSNATDGSKWLLLAATNRFYVRDNVAARLFRLNSGADANNSVLSFDYGGSNYPTNTIELISASGEFDCVNGATGLIPAGANAIVAACLDDNITVGFFSSTQLNFDVKEINATDEGSYGRQLLVDIYSDANETSLGALKRVIQPSALKNAVIGGSGVSALADANITYPAASVRNLTYTGVWAEDFPTSGPLYYLADNGFKPEMILTGVTSDGDEAFAANTAGTITWKALDTTRDPAEWFNSANDFELFWTEKERGYWVYAESGYTNPVTVSGVNLNSSSVVTKHFNNKEKVGDEIQVFNWLDGVITANIGGLVRADGYTSGQTYTVNARLDSDTIPLTTTGAISGANAEFTAQFNDFEVPSLRPTGLRDLNVTATDGLGGKAASGAQIAYVQPATPIIGFSGNTLTLASNVYAKQAVVFSGDPSDESAGFAQRVYNAPLQNDGNGTIDLNALDVDYPAAQAPEPARHIMPDYSATIKHMLVDLRVVAATDDADAPFSVYSNMRQVNYVPAYSDTFHVYANGETNVTVHTAAYGDALDGYLANTEDDIAFRGANAAQLTLIYHPLNPNQGLANNGPQHVDIRVGSANAQIQYLKEYEGAIFYVYDHSNGAWYYGEFPGDAGGVTWGQSGNDLTLSRLPNVKQTLNAPVTNP